MRAGTWGAAKIQAVSAGKLKRLAGLRVRAGDVARAAKCWSSAARSRASGSIVNALLLVGCELGRTRSRPKGG
jgi:hypothetical protein